MQKTIRQSGEWTNNATAHLLYILQNDSEFLKHFNSRTRTAHRLWRDKCDSGFTSGPASEEAVAWLALPDS